MGHKTFIIQFDSEKDYEKFNFNNRTSTFFSISDGPLMIRKNNSLVESASQLSDFKNITTNNVIPAKIPLTVDGDYHIIQGGDIDIDFDQTPNSSGRVFGVISIVGDETNIINNISGFIVDGESLDSSQFNSIKYMAYDGKLTDLSNKTSDLVAVTTAPTISRVEVLNVEPDEMDITFVGIPTDGTITSFSFTGELSGVTISSIISQVANVWKVKLSRSLLNSEVGNLVWVNSDIETNSQFLTDGSIVVINNVVASVPEIGNLLTINTATRETSSGNNIVADASNVSTWGANGLMNEFLASGTNGLIVADIDDISKPYLIGFDALNTNKVYQGIDYGVFFQPIGDIRVIENGSPFVPDVVTTPVNGSKMMIDRTGGVLTVMYAADGVNFNLIHTFGSGITIPLYVNQAIRDNSGFIYNLRGENLS